MIPPKYELLKQAFMASASAETAYNPKSWRGGLDGHCGAVAYSIHRLLGGDILMGTINGERHFWNRPGRGYFAGQEIDFTSEQFGGDGFFPVISGKVMPQRKTVNPRFKRFHNRAIGKFVEMDRI